MIAEKDVNKLLKNHSIKIWNSHILVLKILDCKMVWS